jgi:hypothetical protein
VTLTPQPRERVHPLPTIQSAHVGSDRGFVQVGREETPSKDAAGLTMRMDTDQHIDAQRITRKLNVTLLKPALPTGYLVEPVLVVRQPASVKAPA